jgi:hypothetical protein
VHYITLKPIATAHNAGPNLASQLGEPRSTAAPVEDDDDDADDAAALPVADPAAVPFAVELGLALVV